MAFQFQVSIDGTVFDLPVNWRTIVYDYNFDGENVFLTDVRGKMEFCGLEPYTTLLAQQNESICGISVVEWNVLCDPFITAFTDIFTGNVRRSDFEFVCGRPVRQVELEAIQVNAYRVLEDNQTEEVCVPCGLTPGAGGVPESLEISVHQIQTGATYKEEDGLTDRQFCFIRVQDFIDQMINRLGWTTGGTDPVVSGILNRVFQTDNREVVVPNANDRAITIFIEYETGFQKTITVNVDPGDGVAEIQVLIQKGILAIDTYGVNNGLTPQWDEFQFQPAEVVLLPGTNNPEFRSDHPIRTFTVTGDVNGAYTINLNQDWQYGLQNLIMSVNGLVGSDRLTDSVCCTWAEMKLFLQSIHPIVFGNNSTNGITIESYDDVFNNRVRGVPSTAQFGTEFNTIITPEGGKVRRKARQEILNARGLFGQLWQIENLEECLDSWQWQGTPTGTDVVGDNSGGATGTETVITAGGLPIANGGTYSVTGDLVFGIVAPGSATFKLDILDNAGGTVVSSGIFNTPSNGDVRSVDQLFQDLEFCLAAGDIPVFRWEYAGGGAGPNVTIGTVAAGTTFQINQGNHDDDFPNIREDTSHLGDPYVDFQLFADCDGIFDKEIPERTYAGIGFAIDQQISGCHDYGDTIFVSFLDDVPGVGIGTSTRRFPRTMYFDSGDVDIVDCFRGQIIEYNYHNSPLLWPIIAYEFRNYVPSDQILNLYTQTVTLNSNGPGVEPTVQNFVRDRLDNSHTITRGHDRVFDYEFEVCQTILGVLARSLDRAVTFENCLIDGQTDAIIRRMTSRFDGQGTSTFTVEAP